MRGRSWRGRFAVPGLSYDAGVASEPVPELDVHVQRLDPGLDLPAYAHEGDAAVDLTSAIDVLLAPAGGRALVPTGIAVALPPGHGGFVVPRSGLAANHGVTVLNGPGLIDAGYRGEVRVPLVNTDPSLPAQIRRGDRIAQLVVLPVPRIRWLPVDVLPDHVGQSDDSGRGGRGFGSSGR